MTFDLKAQPTSISFAICGLCRIVSVFFFNLIKMKVNESESESEISMKKPLKLNKHDSCYLILLVQKWKLFIRKLSFFFQL